MTMRRATLLLCLSIAAVAAQDVRKPGPAPTLPYYDWKACPFEGCTYREWTALGPVAVYDTWKRDRRQLGTLTKGEKVTGITGVVITFRPGVIRMMRDLPEAGLKKDETILTYTYLGEGFSSVWLHDAFHAEYDITFTKWPDGQGCGGAHCAATYVDLGKKDWWAQIRLSSGSTGWVDMDHSEFDGIDILARLLQPRLDQDCDLFPGRHADPARKHVEARALDPFQQAAVNLDQRPER